MKRFLAPLTVALLLSLVMITVLGGVAFGVIVLPRFEAEGMSETSGSISMRPDPDGTGPAGPHLRWASGAGVSARASQDIDVPTGSTVNQIQLFTRQASGGNAVFAIYVDGTATANRVGTFSPPAGSTWAIRTVNLSTPLQPGTRHTIHIGPNATFRNNAFIDWFELHGTVTTAAACADGNDNDGDGLVDLADPGCVDAQDNDETNAPPPAAACADGQDNDGDGQIDLADPGCVDAQDNDETNPTPPPSGARPGVGTGTVAECDVVVAASTSNTALTNALNSVPASLGGNHYVICMRGGVHGNYISINPSNTGDSASARLILKSYPGEQASLRGEVQPSSSYNFFTLRDFQVDGRFKRCSNGSIPNPDCGGDVTNQGNPNMRPSLRVSGNAMQIINMDFAGGNDLPNGVGNNLNTRSTCIGYAQSPTNSLIEHSWIHNCGLSAAVSAGEEDAHCIYPSNAGNGGIIRDNLIWDCAESGINGYGSSVGPRNMLFENNIIWRSGPNMSIGGAASGNTVQNSLLLDPTNGKNLAGSAPSTVTNNCLDSPIDNTRVTVSNNVIVSPSQASVSGDPRTGNLTITAPSACLAKYTGTMLAPTV